jgi:hypothetical protein
MVDIRPAEAADRDGVIRFLGRAGGGQRPYERLFDYAWRRPEWNFGYVLTEAGEVRGFLGHIYSERRLGGRLRRLANQTSWFVEPAYRRYSLDLFRAACAEPDVDFTNFSANATVRRILEAYKFRRLDVGKTVVSPHHGLIDRLRIEIAPLQGDEADLDAETRRILDAHLPLGCRAYRVAQGDKAGLVIVLRRLFKGIPYADMLHASVPPRLFLPLGSYLIPRERVVALGVPRRFLGDAPLLFASNRRPTYFASRDLSPGDIDTLFSEFPLLYGSRS